MMRNPRPTLDKVAWRIQWSRERFCQFEEETGKKEHIMKFHYIKFTRKRLYPTRPTTTFQSNLMTVFCIKLTFTSYTGVANKSIYFTIFFSVAENETISLLSVTKNCSIPGQKHNQGTLALCMIINLFLLDPSTCSPRLARWAIRLFQESEGPGWSAFLSLSSESLSKDSGLFSLGPPSSGSWIICFKVSTTSLIFGRSFALFDKQLSANLAIFRAVLIGYWFSRRQSIIMWNFLLLAGKCFTHSKSFCSALGWFLSIDRLPVRISYSTTPKLHTSLLVVRWPVSI